MKQKLCFNMSSHLKRSKFYFLAIAILSFAIVLISYNWNTKENIYKISRDISQIEKVHINLADIKVRDRSVETVLHAGRSEFALNSAKPTEEENTIEKKTVKDRTDVKTVSSEKNIKRVSTTNGVTYVVEKVEHKMNATVQDKNGTKIHKVTTSTVKVNNSEYKIHTKSVQLKNSSQNGDVFRNKVSFQQSSANSTKEKSTKDINETSKLLYSANEDTFDMNGQTTPTRNVVHLDSLNFRKKETREFLDRTNKPKSELLRDHKKVTDSQRSTTSTKRQNAHVVQGKATDRSHTVGGSVDIQHIKNRFKNFGLVGNFINPMLSMSKDNQGSSNNNDIDSDVSSRPDVCVGCFVNSFRKIINEPKICQEDTKLLILITSTTARKDSRIAIRNTWCKKCNTIESDIKYVFVFGNRNNSVENAELLKESEQYHDIIQMDFRDTYANLTYKTLSFFQWSKDYCQKAQYVMKTDDDMYVNTELLPLLLKAAPSEKLLGGTCWGPSSPHRDMNSKWYVSFVQYRHSLFPSMCSGTGYVMSRDTVEGVLRQSPNVPFFHLEDVYVAICAKRLGIVPVLLDGFRNTLVDFEPCLYRNTLITAHEINADTLNFIWKKSRTCPRADLTPEKLYKAYPV